MPSPLVLIAVVTVLGIGAQWLAWRFRLPSILLLLVFGFLAGPVTGFIPQTALGDWVPPFVSLAVGIILFEGGLTLRLDELRQVGKSVLNLITLGVAVTGVLAALGSHFLVGFSWEVSIVIGALLTVTGPTVVIPLLNHVRPSGRVGTIAKWEGITIDPIGAILAVLALETVLLIHEPKAAHGIAVAEGGSGVAGALIQGIFMEIVVGLGVAALGFFGLVQLLRRRLVPDRLQNPIALMVVVAAFALSNTLMEESGLLATTLMGIFVANQNMVSVRRIVEFKEDLRVLLISLLFIVLSARLDISALDVMLDTGPLLFLGFLIVVVRPLSVLISSWGTRLNWKEQAFLAWMAPRGIVAAAVASLFAIRLEPIFPVDAVRIVPVVFLVIVGTVALYGLTISPLARYLGLASPDPQGVVIVGAQDWARTIAKAVQDLGFRVLLLDANTRNVHLAQEAGLEASRANVLSESVFDDEELAGLGRLLAITPNDEVNALAALNFGEIFESDEVFQLSMKAEGHTHTVPENEIPRHLRGRPLFSINASYSSLSDRFEEGARIHTLRLNGRESFKTLKHNNPSMLPLFLASGDKLRVFANEARDITPQAGDRLIALFDEPPSLENNANGDVATDIVTETPNTSEAASHADKAAGATASDKAEVNENG